MSAASPIFAAGYAAGIIVIRRQAAAAIAAGRADVFVYVQKPRMPTSWRAHLGKSRGPVGDVTEVLKRDGLAIVGINFDAAEVVTWCSDELERIQQ